ncbi:16S rRNA (uracil(1498)-N(3))-methyltransferase [Spongiibacter sp. KMU-158]|uniref:Ribosomal RNA small subunit methyltransferase E n=1 Tax=Spongiibacter pelagi TaxID=2760804 RepID=A0A927C3Z3_9GAMM|nr:16S rRNA (uracil(1498)-N(3))-methyltransferase [Spongiibacter pelagi]MBD2859582.1 16S rRNA (uracil(1498)-N(3))-methyltransferase [Spongiibacter pelagi]
MNVILLNPEDFIQENTVQINDHRAKHIREVLKAQVGDTLKCGLLGGKLGSAETVSISDKIELRVSLNAMPPAKLPLTLLLALPRPKAARRILRSATELGVKHIILLNSYRVEKSYWQSPLVDDAHLHAAMIEGLEQSGDTILPTLERAKLFKPFAEDQLPDRLKNTKGWLAHPYASLSLSEYPERNLKESQLLAIGPEGGFIPYEVEKLMAAGCEAFSFGSRILKVETAVPALISKLFL